MSNETTSTVIDLTDESKHDEDKGNGDDVIIVPVYKIVDFSGKPHPYYDDCGCEVCEQHPFTIRAAGRYCECRKCRRAPAKTAK